MVVRTTTSSKLPDMHLFRIYGHRILYNSPLKYICLKMCLRDKCEKECRLQPRMWASDCRHKRHRKLTAMD